MSALGQRHPMLDGAAKVTGTLRYAADLDFPGLVHGAVLTSPYPHARVRHVETREVIADPDVLGVFWHANMPGNLFNSSNWYEDQQTDEDERMFPAIVRHVGDRVAVVVATRPEAAKAALARLRVDYEPLPACLSASAAETATGPQYDPGSGPTFPNPVAEQHFQKGDPDSGLGRAACIVETTVSTPRTHHCAIENHVAIALPEPGGRIRVISPCQSVHAVQLVVAKALGSALGDIHVIKSPVGGSFGGKAEPILEPIVAELARRLGRPVRITYDRALTFGATRTRASSQTRIRSGFDAAGRILARETETLIDIGAYVTGGHYLPGSMLQRHVRLYDIPSERYRGRAVYTNTPPTGAFRGYGSPQINAAGEIHLDIAARRMGLDPVGLRLLNAIAPHAIEPYTGLDVGNARLRECLAEGARTFRWQERRRLDSGTSRIRKGVGMAAAAHVNGCFPGSDEATTMTMSLLRDGRVEMVSALHDLGCGSNTTLAQIAAEVLGIRPVDLAIVEADTDLCGYDLGTRASRMTYSQGEATRLTALALAERILAAAALLRNAEPVELRREAGGILDLRCGERMALPDLAAGLALAGLQLPSATVTHAASANPSSHAAHFAEVEVDTLSGLVRVTDYLAAHDLGRAINPMLVEGQIHGGVQIGIGYALFEDVEIDPVSGKVKSDSFARYHLANSLEMPPIRTLLVDAFEPTGPFGAKAVGEIATIPVAAAVVNAVNHALGSELTDLPLTPERILKALGHA